MLLGWVMATQLVAITPLKYPESHALSVHFNFPILEVSRRFFEAKLQEELQLHREEKKKDGEREAQEAFHACREVSNRYFTICIYMQYLFICLFSSFIVDDRIFL